MFALAANDRQSFKCRRASSVEEILWWYWVRGGSRRNFTRDQAIDAF